MKKCWVTKDISDFLYLSQRMLEENIFTHEKYLSTTLKIIRGVDRVR